MGAVQQAGAPDRERSICAVAPHGWAPSNTLAPPSRVNALRGGTPGPGAGQHPSAPSGGDRSARHTPRTGAGQHTGTSSGGDVLPGCNPGQAPANTPAPRPGATALRGRTPWTGASQHSDEPVRGRSHPGNECRPTGGRHRPRQPLCAVAPR